MMWVGSPKFSKTLACRSDMRTHRSRASWWSSTGLVRDRGRRAAHAGAIASSWAITAARRRDVDEGPEDNGLVKKRRREEEVRDGGVDMTGQVK